MINGGKKSAMQLMSIALAWFLMLTAMGCQAREGTRLDLAPTEPHEAATEAERLSKLCRVWGYVKYTHPAFLLGERDWDEELLALIPQVRELETHEEVNALLHKWFVGLGEIDYGTDEPVAFWADAAAEERLVITDTSWTTDTAYLGEELAGDLGQLGEIPEIRRRKGPVYFQIQSITEVTYPLFNENEYPDMDFADEGYRLLGLFRAWNVLEYYFPYHDLLEEDWEDILNTLIPSMLNGDETGDDQQSYLHTIFKLFAHLHDNHVGVNTHPYFDYVDADKILGLPFSVTEAEGQVVVSGTGGNCPLEMGDVILRVNGLDIKEYGQTLKPYQPCSRDDIFLSRNAAGLIYLMGKNLERVEVVVLRDGEEKAFLCDWIPELSSDATCLKPYLILEGNIGLVNPFILRNTQHSEMMEAMRNTSGLIIDLRQYPKDGMFYFSSYFTTEYAPVFIDASPSIAVPGAYVKEVHSAGYQQSDESRDVYHYDKPVVVLIDEFTQSAGEWTAWSLGKGENVILMGQNTSGALNRIADIPIPGGWWFTFTAVRAELDDGSQLQRVGLTPDIPVVRTIQGIKEGRDELMEAAMEYIVNHK